MTENMPVFRIGDHVAYRTDHPDAPTEFGVVISMNKHYVFVRFDDQPSNAYSKACHPRNLSPIPRIP